MVKCPRCGYKNPSSSVYCENCSYLLSLKKASGADGSKKRKKWNLRIARKIVIVLGLFVIALLLFSFVSYNFQPNNNDTLNVIYDDGSQHQAASYPFKVKIKSDGDWYAKMGNPGFLVEKSGTGPKTVSLDCAAWDDVEINAQKYSGDEELQIQLLKNGEVVSENSTANGTSSVTLYYDS